MNRFNLIINIVILLNIFSCNNNNEDIEKDCGCAGTSIAVIANARGWIDSSDGDQFHILYSAFHRSRLIPCNLKDIVIEDFLYDSAKIIFSGEIKESCDGQNTQDYPVVLTKLEKSRYIIPLHRISICGRQDPLNELTWLNDSIIHRNNENIHPETIWALTYNQKDIFLIVYSGYGAYYPYDCAGNPTEVGDLDPLYKILTEDDIIYTYKIESIKPVSICGFDDPLNNLKWLHDLILYPDKIDARVCEIWQNKYDHKEIIIINSSSVQNIPRYSCYTCNGEKFIVNDSSFFSSLTDSDLIYRWKQSSI